MPTFSPDRPVVSASTISILGAGHCGCAMAADLMASGFDVLLHAHPHHRRVLDAISKGGGLQATGLVTGRFLPRLTTCLVEALEFSTTVVVALPASAHDGLIAALAGHDLRSHCLIGINGNFFVLGAARVVSAGLVVETSTSPFAARVRGNVVNLRGRKAMMWAGGQRMPDVQEKALVQRVFSMPLEWMSSALAVDLSCVTGVMHPAPMLMNAGRIESTVEGFLFYREGMTRAVGKVMHAVDDERCAIAAALGLALPSALGIMNRYYGLSHDCLSGFAAHSEVHNVEKSAPTSLEHRYLSQDIPYVLAPWAALGQRLGVPTPTIDALMRLASLATGGPTAGRGRTLESIGLDRLTARELGRLALGEAACSMQLSD